MILSNRQQDWIKEMQQHAEVDGIIEHGKKEEETLRLQFKELQDAQKSEVRSKKT